MSAGGMGGQGQPMGGAGKGGMNMPQGPAGGGKGGMGMNRGPLGNAQNRLGGFMPFSPTRPTFGSVEQVGNPQSLPTNPFAGNSQSQTLPVSMTPIQGLRNYGGIAAPTPRKPVPTGGLLSNLYGNFGG